MAEETAAAGASSSRQEFERDVLERAAADPAFRAELLANSRAAILKIYGVELPPSIELKVLEETPTTFYLVLPAQTDELTDEQLAAVAGGAGVAGIFPKVETGGTFDKFNVGSMLKGEMPGASLATALPGFPKHE
jgi:hypothetical protein